MHALPLFVLLLAVSVHASIYVTQPVQATTCTGGQSCLVQWRDDGQAPLLAAIGECQVGLYEIVSNTIVLAQPLPSVDVSSTTSFSFTLDPNAGTNGQYHIVFTSNNINYRAFSAIFTVTGLTGTTPGGGLSAPASTPSGSSNTGTSPTGTPSTSGTSIPVAGTTTSTPSAGTTAATGPTTFTTRTTTSAGMSTSASATATSAASRVGFSTPLGGLAAIFVLSCVLAF